MPFCKKCNPYEELPAEIEHLSPGLCREALKNEVRSLTKKNVKLRGENERLKRQMKTRKAYG